MNRAQSFAHEPDGTGLRHMVAAMFAPKATPFKQSRAMTTEFRRAAWDAIPLDQHIGIIEIYNLVPARLRSAESYGTLSKMLQRWGDLARIERKGACGHYRYMRVK